MFNLYSSYCLTNARRADLIANLEISRKETLVFKKNSFRMFFQSLRLCMFYTEVTYACVSNRSAGVDPGSLKGSIVVRLMNEKEGRGELY